MDNQIIFYNKEYYDINGGNSKLDCKFYLNLYKKIYTHDSRTSILKLLDGSYISNELFRITKLHGIFNQKFFRIAINEHVILKREEINIILLANLELFNVVNYIDFKKSKRYEIKNEVIQMLYIYYMNHNTHIDKEKNKRLILNNVEKKCYICDIKFNLVNLPDWLYFGTNGYKECCFTCKMNKPKKKDLFILIPEFIKALGFIPNANFSFLNYEFTSRISYNYYSDVLNLYKKMGGYNHIRKKFGNWFEALVKTGCLENNQLKTGRGIKCLSTDGHICNSLCELYIDNRFFNNKINHIKEPIYPFDPEYNTTNKRADRLVGESVYVEFFGLVGDLKYEEKLFSKIQLCKKNNLDLIALYENDLKVEILENKFQSFFVK